MVLKDYLLIINVYMASYSITMTFIMFILKTRLILEIIKISLNLVLYNVVYDIY